MKRREFITGLLLAATMRRAKAQQTTKVYRIAIVHPSSGMVHHFKAATTTIPIVGVMSDPVSFGLVAGLAKPGGNITGFSVDAGLEMWGKRLEMLREAIPNIARVGFLTSSQAWEGQQGTAVRVAAQQSGISLVGPQLEGTIQETEYRRVFAAMKEERADAIFVGDQPENYANLRLISELSKKSRLPVIYPFLEGGGLGGLLSYGPDITDIFRRSVLYIDRILKGTDPGDLPVQQPAKFELVINLKTAKELGLTVPPSLLVRADTRWWRTRDSPMASCRR
jgi:putative tryptophan/tyrosine transport system substrate-binding protein